MRKILITGGAGFVGRHFTRHFLEAGDEVHVVDSLEKHTGAIDPWGKWPLFDPCDYRNFTFGRWDCRDYFNKFANKRFDLVLHLAAMVGGRLMIENNPLAVADDLSIDAAFWQWAKKAEPKKIICFSSSAAYPVKYQGLRNHFLLNEDLISFHSGSEIGMPDMTYGWTKLTCEYLARLAYERHGLKSVVYRPFSGYGCDQDDHYPFSSILQRVLKNRNNSELQVWGNGHQMRDFIHIDDCVRGVITTMDKIDNGDAINLSTGIYTSFIEFAKIAANMLGYNPIVKGMENMPMGVYARGGDTSKQRKLGFEHKISFAEGIERGLKYYESKD